MRSALIQFFKHEKNRIISYIEKKIASIIDMGAEDVLHDVMLKMLSLPGENINIDNISSYVYRSVNNRIIDGYRRKKNIISIDNDADCNESRDFLIKGSNSSIIDELHSKELREFIYRIVEKLPDKQKAVWIATEIEGKKITELSVEWGISVNTLLSRKHRANLVLRDALSGY